MSKVSDYTEEQLREMKQELEDHLTKLEAERRDRYYAVCLSCNRLLSRKEYEGDACPGCGSAEARKVTWA